MKLWIVLATALLLSSCKFPDTACAGVKPGARIASVGGCNRDGWCGATLNDGTVVIGAYLPTIGAAPFGWGCRKQ